MEYAEIKKAVNAEHVEDAREGKWNVGGQRREGDGVGDQTLSTRKRGRRRCCTPL